MGLTWKEMVLFLTLRKTMPGISDLPRGMRTIEPGVSGRSEE